MTPLTLMPTAPPARPVAPAGGGVADSPSSSSFESALQRAGADNDASRAEPKRSDAKPVARPAPDEPAARSTAPAKKTQDGRAPARDGASTADADDAKPARTRDAASRDSASSKHLSKDSPKELPADAQLVPASGSIPVPVDIAVATVATGKVDIATNVVDAAQAADTKLLGAAKPQTASETSLTPSTGHAAKTPKSAVKPEVSAEQPAGLGDLTERNEPPTGTRAEQPAVASHPQATPSTSATRPSSQAARTLLADALQRAAATDVQAAQATTHAHPVAPTSETAVAAAVVKPSAVQATPPGADNAPVAKAAGKAQAAAPSLQDAGVVALGTTEHEGASAGNGGTSTGSGRRDNTPTTPQAKSEAPISWPTAFAVRVPEAMTSSLERTGSAAPTLPAAVTQQDLSNVGPQLVRGLQLQAHAGGGDMKMTLNPEHLGSVTIEVQVRRDRVSATLTAETPEVRQWIATHQADLKNSLAGVGLTLEDLVVKDEGGGGRQDARDDEQPQSGRRQPAPEQTEAQFEVLV